MFDDFIENNDKSEKGQHFHSLERRSIYVTGQIKGCDGARIVDMLHEISAEDPKKDIFMFINSGGGSVVDGFQVAENMKLLPNKVVTIGQGWVGSMAVPIFAAGDLRCATNNTVFLLHEMSNARSHRFLSQSIAVGHRMQKLQEKYAQFLADQTKAPASFWAKQMRPEDGYMEMSEALKKGLVDEEVKDLSFAVKKYKNSSTTKKKSSGKKKEK